MHNLAGLTPTIVEGIVPCLTWTGQGRSIQTDFDRFRPVKLQVHADGRPAHVTWRDFGELPLTDHFYDFACERAALLEHASPEFYTSFDIVSAVARQAGKLPFSGLTFHMARTGSTLIHRLLSRTGAVHSLSEVTVLDVTAKHTHGWPEEQRIRLIRDLLDAFRRPRRPNERHFALKMTDAMSTIRLPLYRAAFPDIPWIFVYRDPIEVMVSALQRPTGTMETWFHNRTNSAERLAMPELADPSMWPDEFMARTLGRTCAVAVEAAQSTPSGKFLAVSYKRLPHAVWETIAPHFGIELTARDRELMEDEAKYHSKRSDPTEFRPDSERKQRAAGKKAIELAEKYVRPVIEQLEKLPQG